jgi:hypothetical protein
MRSAVFIALGLGFVLMGGGLYALTLIKTKPLPSNPTKAQLREQAAMAAENRKMRIAAGVIAGIGVLIAVVFLF